MINARKPGPAAICVTITAGLCLSASMHFVRAEVVADALVAQERMQAVRRAVLIYANDSECELDDLTLLYGDLISDPLVFWHPGDPDAPPVTIDNEVPDAPNSAQISFTVTRPVCGGPIDRVNVRDNGPENNGGLFTQCLAGGVIETEPVNAMPVPTKVTRVRAHLRNIGFAISLYQNDYEEWLPTRLSLLYPDYLGAPRTFWNPGDSDPLPLHLDNDMPNGANSALVSFDYPAAGLTENQITPETVVIMDNSPANNDGFGINVLYGDRTVRFIPIGTPGDADDDGDIDLSDWAGFQRCYTEDNPVGIVDDSCRILDFDGDNQVRGNDHDAMASALTGPVER